MLDDLKYIHDKDAQDALGIAEKQGQQLKHDFGTLELQGLDTNPIHNIVIAGMGGSALSAMYLRSWPGLALPIDIVRDYVVPEYVNKNTLVIASSYSGNTEESVSALHDAESKGARIVVIASGGVLIDLAKQKDLPFLIIPTGYQPRHVVLYSLRALLVILHSAGVVGQDVLDELSAASDFVQQATATWRPDVPTANNQAKQLALELAGSSPVIYAGPKLYPTAYKWKISFNENAKNVAWCDGFSEFNHNEFLGWTSHPIDKPYKIIELQSNLEHPQIQKRFTITNKLLSGRWPEPHIITAHGETLLQQLLWTTALGDFTTLYVALLNGLNPTPVELIERLKTELAQ